MPREKLDLGPTGPQISSRLFVETRGVVLTGSVFREVLGIAVADPTVAERSRLSESTFAEQ